MIKRGSPRSPMRPGHFAVKIQARSVGADVDRAQAHAARGLDPLLLIAIADAGVDVEAAEAEAVAAVTPAMAPMAVVEAAGGSGRCSGKREGSGGDQSDGNLAKHCVLQLVAQGRCFVPAPSSEQPRHSFMRVSGNRVSGVF